MRDIDDMRSLDDARLIEEWWGDANTSEHEEWYDSYSDDEE